jgi:oligopeptide/dipeptide ABC transporter ATP-binding protein
LAIQSVCFVIQQNNALSNGIHAAFYETLVTYNSTTFRPEPLLATSWTKISARQMRFNLRSGVKFSDGSAMTADDVVFSLNRAMSKTSNFSPYTQDEVAVMYLGRIVEKGPTQKIFAVPRHPYTRLLMDAIPRTSGINRDRSPIQGEVPNPLAPPSGCAFHPRCPRATDICESVDPQVKVVSGVEVACHWPHGL